ncbi:MAG: small multi-drug export protein [bacterium]
MADQIAAYFSGIPNHWITFCLAMLPITELRGSIPWAILLGDLNWKEAFLWSILGNFVPVIPVLLLLEPCAKFLRRWKLFDRFFEWLFTRTRRKGKVVERYKALGLMIFVGIPLPGTGAWTGALAAFIFGIPFPLALISILLGVILAGVLVTGVVVGGSTAFQAIFGIG